MNSGGIDIVTTQRRVTTQPAVPDLLFTSANDLTYVPRQNEDIKFTIRRAVFDVSDAGGPW